SLAWEGTNSHNCGMIISSIKTNSTKEISNHDQVTLDLGRLPQACYLGDSGKRDLRKKEKLEYAQNALGEFGGNNRTGIAGTLHRISAIRNKNGRVVGLTCRLGRPVREIIDMTRDLLEYGKSILFLGRLLLTQAMKLEVMDRGARRLQVPDPCTKHKVMIEAVDYHMPEMSIFRCRLLLTQAMKLEVMDRGARRLQVPDPCTKHKVMIEAVDNHMPEDQKLQENHSERRSAPAFPFLIEMRERDYWVAHRGTPLLWKQIGLNSWRIDSDFFNLVDCCLAQAMKLEVMDIPMLSQAVKKPLVCCDKLKQATTSRAIINQKNSNSHGGDIAAVLLLHFCPAAAAAFCCCCCFALLLLPFCSCCCCILLLLMLLLHYYSAAAAAAFCCCVLLLRFATAQLRFANAAAVTLDLGRLPQACYLGDSGKRDLRKKEVSIEELEYAQNALGEFGGNNRTGIAGTLHRISPSGIRMGELLFGRPGVGKTTVIRGISHVLSYELLKRVVPDPCMKHKVMIEAVDNHMPERISLHSQSKLQYMDTRCRFSDADCFDTSNEIGGDGDIPHPAIGGARRLQVPDPCMKHKVMIEAVDNHMPEIVVDTSNEIGGDGDIPHPAIGEHGDCRLLLTQAMKLEVMGYSTSSNRGSTEIADIRESVSIVSLSCSIRIPDVDFRMQVGGLKTVILSDEAARTRNCKKIILERRSAPAFPFLIEMRERDYWVAHRGTPLLWKQIGLNSWRIDSDFFNLVDCCLTQAMKLEAIINQKNSNSHGGDIAAVLLLHFCPAAAAAFCSCCCCILLLLLLHFASADAAAALLLCCRCCCYALLLRFAAAFCYCCSCVLLMLRLYFAAAAVCFVEATPCSLAWEGTNSHNCGLIISSIKTNSTKEISNHDQVSIEELEYAQNALGEFGGDNRTGIAGTLHRISAIRNKNGRVVELPSTLTWKTPKPLRRRAVERKEAKEKSLSKKPRIEVRDKKSLFQSVNTVYAPFVPISQTLWLSKENAYWLDPNRGRTVYTIPSPRSSIIFITIMAILLKNAGTSKMNSNGLFKMDSYKNMYVGRRLEVRDPIRSGKTTKQNRRRPPVHIIFLKKVPSMLQATWPNQ
ncbi:UNVERIFIED_CONTAM: putative protein ycf45, partial [Sesamum calycinum]